MSLSVFKWIARHHKMWTGHKTQFNADQWECLSHGCLFSERNHLTNGTACRSMSSMKTTSPTLNINMGNFRTAKDRREAYEKAAARENSGSLGAWIKKHLDKLAGFNKNKKEIA